MGVGVEHVRLRAYRDLGHAESVACKSSSALQYITFTLQPD